jgi:hypothetical protein
VQDPADVHVDQRGHEDPDTDAPESGITTAAPIYRKTGNPRAIQLLPGRNRRPGYSSPSGIEVDDGMEIAGQIDI